MSHENAQKTQNESREGAEPQSECQDVCIKVLHMLKDAGENLFSEIQDHGELVQRSVCSNIMDMVDHEEFLKRLKNYKLIKINTSGTSVPSVAENKIEWPENEKISEWDGK